MARWTLPLRCSGPTAAYFLYLWLGAAWMHGLRQLLLAAAQYDAIATYNGPDVLTAICLVADIGPAHRVL